MNFPRTLVYNVSKECATELARCRRCERAAAVPCGIIEDSPSLLVRMKGIRRQPISSCQNEGNQLSKSGRLRVVSHPSPPPPPQSNCSLQRRTTACRIEQKILVFSFCFYAVDVPEPRIPVSTSLYELPAPCVPDKWPVVTSNKAWLVCPPGVDTVMSA